MVMTLNHGFYGKRYNFHEIINEQIVDYHLLCGLLINIQAAEYLH